MVRRSECVKPPRTIVVIPIPHVVSAVYVPPWVACISTIHSSAPVVIKVLVCHPIMRIPATVMVGMSVRITESSVVAKHNAYRIYLIDALTVCVIVSGRMSKRLKVCFRSPEGGRYAGQSQDKKCKTDAC